MATMKAIVVEEFGEPEVLQPVEVDRPEPGEGEVLVKVAAAGVNYADTMRRRDQYLKKQTLPFIPGSEVAGTVESVGSGVSNVTEGDEVEEGDVLLVLEAMKMENPVKAHKAGKVTGLAAEAGSTVKKGDVLLEIKDAE